MKLAIVGCGAIAEKAHIPAAQDVEGVRLVALVDGDRARAETLTSRFNIPVAATKLQNIASDVDAVVLATPPHVRPTLAEDAFAARLHVLCEKPMANTAKECEAIIAAANEAGCTLAVAHNYRFLPNRIHVHQMLCRQDIGSVRRVHVEQGAPASWPTRTGYTFRREMVKGGVLLNEGIHCLDTLFWWLGPPQDFEYEDDAIGGLESNVRVRMRFAGGVDGHFRLSRTCRLENQFVIECEGGVIRLPIYDQATVSVTKSGNESHILLADRAFDLVASARAQLRDFTDSVITGCPPQVTGEHGLRVIKFIQACYAAKSSRPLPKHAPVPGVTW